MHCCFYIGVVSKSQGTQIQPPMMLQERRGGAGQQRFLVQPHFGDHVPIGCWEHEHAPPPETDGTRGTRGQRKRNRECVPGSKEVIEVHFFSGSRLLVELSAPLSLGSEPQRKLVAPSQPSMLEGGRIEIRHLLHMYIDNNCKQLFL